MTEKPVCIWKACDSYTTRAVQGIDGNGQRSNCGRTNKDGIDFVKETRPVLSDILYFIIHHGRSADVPVAVFFAMCKGQCPGTAIEGDWRNRTEYCEVWYSIFEHVENELQRANQWVLSALKMSL